MLARHYADVGRQLFVNLVQTQGQEVVITVLTFLSRLEDMARGEEPFGADGPAARQLLAERGLTEQREAEAHALMAEARDLKSTPADPPRTAEEQAAAESALWAWYLEWSAIARVAIKSRATLRKLGFFKRRTSGPDEEPIEVAELGDPGDNCSPADYWDNVGNSDCELISCDTRLRFPVSSGKYIDGVTTAADCVIGWYGSLAKYSSGGNTFVGYGIAGPAACLFFAANPAAHFYLK